MDLPEDGRPYKVILLTQQGATRRGQRQGWGGEQAVGAHRLPEGQSLHQLMQLGRHPPRRRRGVKFKVSHAALAPFRLSNISECKPCQEQGGSGTYGYPSEMPLARKRG